MLLGAVKAGPLSLGCPTYILYLVSLFLSLGRGRHTILCLSDEFLPSVPQRGLAWLLLPFFSEMRSWVVGDG